MEEGFQVVTKSKSKIEDDTPVDDSGVTGVMALINREDPASESEPVRELGVFSKPKKKPLVKPNYNPEAVSLRIFITACGKAYNQTAGFQSYANRMGLKPRPMAAWREEFDKFLNRPVNGG